ncbi:hypothetical protein J3T65_11660 [Staphylococcus simiae]|uniref:hypothetical protein n=1 Tax=Staphylococcus simiae TaxID=308354 RepID=UPI001A96E27C|nr:hypothetical protein [Staphylococcus simiae]MBO1200007.1 hypothetical protein [Staphylococcus simiae]MBO1202268.1 hypothetical protein [Staphylococcus simiae]MBO1204524.1 hypothetical protein [Staphylococcus simiae]MBO1212067.1 hypothetical protein [Staphylococcus simiae]MBO1230693.1 hypothetical protein [Staphylococcus simiae]
MKLFAIILGLLVIISWIFVFREYKLGNKNNDKTKNIMLIACILTLVMTILQRFY